MLQIFLSGESSRVGFRKARPPQPRSERFLPETSSGIEPFLGAFFPCWSRLAA
jgi:hypothetical protein